MCGIAGYFSISDQAASAEYIQAAKDALSHRGPDSSGDYSEQGITLIHTRLAILDLSPGGAQPMSSPSKRYVISYNGEIYNFPLLKAQLEKLGYAFVGGSDTEVLLAAIEEWGLEATLDKIDGMFAFALWDKKEQKLYLVRDRFGEKPLYYYIDDQKLIFASELRAIIRYKNITLTIDQSALALLLEFSTIAAPYSIYREVRKLEAGSIIKFRRSEQTLSYDISYYWKVKDHFYLAAIEPFEGNLNDAILRLHELLVRSVRSRRLADVAVGSFLSGGIDSSLITALLVADKGSQVKTFSIGFEDKAWDESLYASKVAQHLGTEHYNLIVSEKMLLDVVPELSSIYDEPFADSSQIPTYILSKFSKQQVSVALSGDGGDELFGGYIRYNLAKIFSLTAYLPLQLRKILRILLQYSNEAAKHSLKLVTSNPLIMHRYYQRLERLAEVIDYRDLAEMYTKSLSFLYRYDNIFQLPIMHYTTGISNPSNYDSKLALRRNLMLVDTLDYLPSDILTKVDRAAMSLSLETRIPFLSPDIFHFSCTLPEEFLFTKGERKVILKKLLANFLPEELVNRPKMGFAVPLANWLRKELKEYSRQLIFSELIDNTPLNPDGVRKLWKDFQAGRNQRSSLLWNIVIFLGWKATYRAFE
jgi:asparagine synthase (glutamine-hydrolysing)